MIAIILLIIGGLNWLIIGVFNKNVVDMLGMTVARIVYILVGLSAVNEIFTHKSTCMECNKSMNKPAM